MSLHAWQTSLSDLVIARAAGVPASVTAADACLSDAERHWLTRLTDTPGFRVTCDIQRWWREFRVQSAAPLTLSLLGPGRRQDVVLEFARRNPKPSSFFIREALPFLDLAAELAPDVPHLTELAAFERAMLLLGQALAGGQAVGVGELDPHANVQAHPLAAVVRFKAPPDRILAAAARGLALPPVEDRAYCLLIATRLPNLARACSGDEAAVFDTLRQGPADPCALGGDPVSAAALTTLWQAGALRQAA
ncbi:MAG TPA: hypothetical protein VKV73_22365 [Chloroflexota bacterium]|nr:hypothetical protein [Chloroflexota bacterium]